MKTSFAGRFKSTIEYGDAPPFAAFAAVFLFSLCFIRSASALGPHEVLLLANIREPESVAIATAYRQWRNIPVSNLILLDAGVSSDSGFLSMTPEAFTERIWEPSRIVMEERGIEKHILAWVYSTHFPIRIKTSPPMSLQGLTFVRNRIPSMDSILDGTYVSPLFPGAGEPGGLQFRPQSFDVAAAVLRDQMPLPCMALGYTGPNGNTAEEVLAMLKRGIAADATEPKGTVFFVTRDDIRSKAREWQFAPAAATLQRMGIEAVITNAMPKNHPSILGLMTGTPTLTPAEAGQFVPGAMADHLTSFSAAFDQPSQTKISSWIRAGATASAGTVTEPMSYWSKFPHAFFFSHYRMGCTMIESFYQAVRSPLQLMIIGEPLASPWGTKASLIIKGIEDGESLESSRAIDLHITAPQGTFYSRYVYLVNGRIAGEGTRFTLAPDGLEPGIHELRAVAYQTGLIRHKVSGVLSFRVP